MGVSKKVSVSPTSASRDNQLYSVFCPNWDESKIVRGSSGNPEATAAASGALAQGWDPRVMPLSQQA